MDNNFVRIAQEGLKLVLVLSAPPVLTALVVGLLVSLLQATTQVQEQTLTFVPKLVAIIFVLIVFGSAGMSQLMQFTEMLFSGFPSYIK